MTTHTYTSVWSDLREVEFCQGFLRAGEYRTRYLHAGDESKPPLLMLHGITGHAEAYVRNLRSHGEHFSCWAIDLIGHGKEHCGPEWGSAELARRPMRSDLAPAGNLPADTRLWAMLQAVSGGTWGGCVYDVGAVRDRLELPP